MKKEDIDNSLKSINLFLDLLCQVDTEYHWLPIGDSIGVYRIHEGTDSFFNVSFFLNPVAQEKYMDALRIVWKNYSTSNWQNDLFLVALVYLEMYKAGDSVMKKVTYGK
jgi:hypothetical protein